MYNFLLAAHSIVRWLVIIGLLFTLFRAYRGWIMEKSFTRQDHRIRNISTGIVHLQLVLGLLLYIISPVIRPIFENFSDAVGETGIRYFAMEHSVMMLIAVVVITIGSRKVKKKSRDREKFKTTAIWFTLAMAIILISIPWPFLSSVGRPLFGFFK